MQYTPILLVGSTLLRSMMGDITGWLGTLWLQMLMPRVKGHTSVSTSSRRPSARAFIPAQMPAPRATAVSAWEPSLISRPRDLAIYPRTAGIRLDPPTITSSSTAKAGVPLSTSTLRMGVVSRLKRGLLLRISHSLVRGSAW